MFELTGIAVQQCAAEYISTVLGTLVAPEEVPEPLAVRTFELLSRRDEINGRRDAWGNWEGPDGKPGASFQTAFLDREILEWCARVGKQKGGGLWPGAAKWAVCLTHDLDFVSRYARWREAGLRLRRLGRDGGGAGRFLRRVGGGLLRSVGGLRVDPWWCYEQWIALAQESGGHSTWLVFPQDVSNPHSWDSAISFSETIHFGGRKMRVCEMLKEVAAAGMEIGLHPSIHAARDARQIAQQRRQVEDAAAVAVTTVRQHFLRWDADCTPSQQLAAGLEVDSTLGFNRGVGFRTGGCFPYRMPNPATGERSDLVQIPMQLMDVSIFSPDGLGCRTVDEATSVCLKIMNEVEAVGGVLVLNWHQNSISEENMMEVIRNVLQEAKRRHPWFASLGEVAEHWKQRRA